MHWKALAPWVPSSSWSSAHYLHFMTWILHFCTFMTSKIKSIIKTWLTLRPNIIFFWGGGGMNSLCSAVNQNGDLFIFDGHHHMVDENEMIWCCEWNDLPVNCCVGILRWRLPLGVQICQCSGLARRPQTKSQSRGEKKSEMKVGHSISETKSWRDTKYNLSETLD